jgi:hypothetical protein
MADKPVDTVLGMYAAGAQAHAKAVADFLNELYAIMVDPCAEGTITVDEMKAALVKAAIRDRDVSIYVQHKSDCMWLRRHNDTLPCTCGLVSILHRP